MLDKPQPQLPPDLYKRAALTYAKLGFAVLPIHSATDGQCSCGKLHCKSAGKHAVSSLVPHGVKEAIKDLDTIRRWWDRYPSANVGIAAGRVSNVVVIDIDGIPGRETLRYLVGDHSPTTDWTVTTGRKDGGAHLYFRYPERGTVPSYKYGGLEVRSDGQYIVAPPSVHQSGNHYSWPVFTEKQMSLSGTPLDPLPEVFYDFAANKLKPGTDQPRATVTIDDMLKDSTLGRETGDPPLHTEHEEKRVRQALACVPSDERDIWLTVGMVLHWTRWACARTIWDDWSRGSEKFNESDQDKTWLGFRANRDWCITLGSLFKLAQDNGWQPFSDEIDEINAKFFLINNYGGHSVVGWLEQNETDTGVTLQVQKHKDFTTRFSNRFVTNEATGRTVALGNYWLNHPRRREYEVWI
jgi:Bifunctional DNA primase/polymerase, N-terminal/Primase C terminal 2 (PriCT-2)